MTYENPVNGINQMGYSGVYSSKRLSIACHLALRRIASGLSSGTLPLASANALRAFELAAGAGIEPILGYSYERRVQLAHNIY